MSTVEKSHRANPPSLQRSRASIVVGIITISDRASTCEYEDLGGPVLKEAAQKYGWQARLLLIGARLGNTWKDRTILEVVLA